MEKLKSLNWNQGLKRLWIVFYVGWVISWLVIFVGFLVKETKGEWELIARELETTPAIIFAYIFVYLFILPALIAPIFWVARFAMKQMFFGFRNFMSWMQEDGDIVGWLASRNYLQGLMSLWTVFYFGWILGWSAFFAGLIAKETKRDWELIVGEFGITPAVVTAFYIAFLFIVPALFIPTCKVARWIFLGFKNNSVEKG
jgi:hypothetical protein